MNKSLYILTVILSSASVMKGQASADRMQILSNNDRYVLRATVVDRNTGRAAQNVRSFVSVSGARFQMNTAVSDTSGHLKFLMKGMDTPHQLILQTGGTQNNKYQITVEKDFISKFSSEKITEPVIVVDTLPFFGYADKTYLLDNYTRFPTMEEIFREYVYEVKARRTGPNFRLSVLNKPYMLYFDEEPLVLIDGVPVFDINKLMQLDPLRMYKLEVIARKYYYGNLICFGILSFTSYDGDLAGYPLPADALVTESAASK